MKDVQSRVHIENINKYIKLAPLPFRGDGGQKSDLGFYKYRFSESDLFQLLHLR